MLETLACLKRLIKNKHFSRAATVDVDSGFARVAGQSLLRRHVSLIRMMMTLMMITMTMMMMMMMMMCVRKKKRSRRSTLAKRLMMMLITTMTMMAMMMLMRRIIMDLGGFHHFPYHKHPVLKVQEAPSDRWAIQLWWSSVTRWREYWREQLGIPRWEKFIMMIVLRRMVNVDNEAPQGLSGRTSQAPLSRLKDWSATLFWWWWWWCFRWGGLLIRVPSTLQVQDTKE